MINKSGVSVSLEEHLIIYLSSLNSFTVSCPCVPMPSRAAARAQFLYLTQLLPTARACLCPPVQRPVHSFYLLLDLDLGSFECCVFEVCKARYITWSLSDTGLRRLTAIDLPPVISSGLSVPVSPSPSQPT